MGKNLKLLGFTFIAVLIFNYCFISSLSAATVELKEAFFKKAIGFIEANNDNQKACLSFMVDYDRIAVPSECELNKNDSKNLVFRNEIGHFFVKQRESKIKNSVLIFYDLIQIDEKSTPVYFNSWFLQPDLFSSKEAPIKAVSLLETGEVFLKTFPSLNDLFKEINSVSFSKNFPHFYLIKENKIVGWQKEVTRSKNKKYKIVLFDSSENEKITKQAVSYKSASYSMDFEIVVCTDRDGNVVSCDKKPKENNERPQENNEKSKENDKKPDVVNRDRTLPGSERNDSYEPSEQIVKTEEVSEKQKHKILEITKNYLKLTQKPPVPVFYKTDNPRQYAARVESFINSQLKDQYYSDRMLFVNAGKNWIECGEFFEKVGFYETGFAFKEHAKIFLKNALIVAAQMTPGLSTFLDIKSLVTGYDSLTGEKLSNVEKTIIVSMMVPSIFVAPLRGTAKIINDLVSSGSHIKIPLSDEVLEKIHDIADIAGFDLTKLASGPAKVNQVILETLSQTGSFTSKVILTAEEFLEAGGKWLGDGYKNIGSPDSGVYLSLDGKRKFRMDKNSIMGRHDPYQSHGHFEIIENGGSKNNNHILIKE